jgi:hypothetical protein
MDFGLKDGHVAEMHGKRSVVHSEIIVVTQNMPRLSLALIMENQIQNHFIQTVSVANHSSTKNQAKREKMKAMTDVFIIKVFSGLKARNQVKVYGHVVMPRKEKHKDVLRTIINLLNGQMKSLRNISLISL